MEGMQKEREGRKEGVGEKSRVRDTEAPLLSSSTHAASPNHSPSSPSSSPSPPHSPHVTPPTPQLASTHAPTMAKNVGGSAHGSQRVMMPAALRQQRVKHSKSHDLSSGGEQTQTNTSVGSMQVEELATPTGEENVGHVYTYARLSQIGRASWRERV